MKWYKHPTDSLDDPFMFDLLDRHGPAGYLVYHGVLEIAAGQFDVNSPKSCVISQRFLAKKLQLSWQKVKKILNFCHERGEILITENGSEVTLNCPKLEQLADEYTQRKLGKKSGHYPDSVPTVSGKNLQEAELEAELEALKHKPASSNSKHFEDQDAKYLEPIRELCQKLSKKSKGTKSFNPFAWVQQQIKSRKHPGAVLKALQALMNHWETTKNPIGYLNSIVKTESGNFYFNDHMSREAQEKEEWNSAGRILSEIFK